MADDGSRRDDSGDLPPGQGDRGASGPPPGQTTDDAGGAPTAPKEPAGEPPAPRPETHEGPATIIEDRGPPTSTTSPAQWVRENLFNSTFNSILTIVFAIIVGYFLYKSVTFVLLTGRWDIVNRNLRLFMVFRFPVDALWSVWVASGIAAFAAGVGTGQTARQRLELAEAHDLDLPPAGIRQVLRRVGPVLALTVVLLVLVETITPIVLTVGVGGLAVAGGLLGRRVPTRWSRWLNLAVVAGFVAAFGMIVWVAGVGWEHWGGLLLTLLFALAGVIASFPIGVLLALGRRSSFPAVRMVCVGYIELIRGVPLITLLFMGFFVIGLFIPAQFATPSTVTRAIIAFILFTAAYLAEIVRGGLQSVPRGQIEAAQAVGLSPITTTRKIVLPQALRAVIPALVGQFISLFKDTSLAAIVGLTELLAISRIVVNQPDFIAQGLFAETLAFVAFIYWVGSYTMSRESQRLEQRLGVGER